MFTLMPTSEKILYNRGVCIYVCNVMLTLWLCSDSCHTCADSKQLLINLSFILSQILDSIFVNFFHLGLVLCFNLHLINRSTSFFE